MVAGVPSSLSDAYGYCARVAREHYENFPVASRLLPRRMRPHLAAIYAFARVADDYADEGQRDPAERLTLLDEWRRRLRACAAGEPDQPQAPHRAVFAALAHTIATCRLPAQLLDDLLSAFIQDVTTKRYDTWGEVLDYCRRSANPVGRLVLRVAGHEDAALDLSSDSLCTALQLTNFWQDLERDWAAGRLYVPLETASGFGALAEDFDPAALSLRWQSALGHAADRTRTLFEEGRHVCDGVPGRLRLELRLTWLGGMTILDRLVAARFDVHRARPTLRVRDAPGLLWRAIRWNAKDSSRRQA